MAVDIFPLLLLLLLLLMLLLGLLSGSSFFLRGFRRGAAAVLAPIDFADFTPPPSFSSVGLLSRSNEAALVDDCPAAAAVVAVCRVGELGEGGDERPGEVLSPRFA